MFDIGATELLVIVIVAIIAIGPKDLPLALRTAGRWMGKARRMSGHFRAGMDAMIRDAEMEEMEREWRERNAQIMQSHPHAAEPARLAEPSGTTPADLPPPAASAEARVIPQPIAGASDAAALNAAAGQAAGERTRGPQAE